MVALKDRDGDPAPPCACRCCCTTNSLTYGIELTGTAVASATAIAVNQAPGQPATYPVTATRDVGAAVAGVLIAAADSPTAPQGAFTACSGAGLTSVSLTGVETIASAA